MGIHMWPKWESTGKLTLIEQLPSADISLNTRIFFIVEFKFTIVVLRILDKAIGKNISPSQALTCQSPKVGAIYKVRMNTGCPYVL